MKITTKIDWKRNIVSITAITILTLLTTANAAPACQGTPVTTCNASLIPADQPCANYYVLGSFCDGVTPTIPIYDPQTGMYSPGPGCNGTLHRGKQCSGTNGNCTDGGGYCD